MTDPGGEAEVIDHGHEPTEPVSIGINVALVYCGRCKRLLSDASGLRPAALLDCYSGED